MLPVLYHDAAGLTPIVTLDAAPPRHPRALPQPLTSSCSAPPRVGGWGAIPLLVSLRMLPQLPQEVVDHSLLIVRRFPAPLLLRGAIVKRQHEPVDDRLERLVRRERHPRPRQLGPHQLGQLLGA